MHDEKDILKDLFSEKLENYEAKVNPELWNAIASKIGSTASASSSISSAIVSKIIIGSSIATAIAIGGYLYQSSNGKNKTVFLKDTAIYSSNSINKIANKSEENPNKFEKTVQTNQIKPLQNSISNNPFINIGIKDEGTSFGSAACYGLPSINESIIKENIIQTTDDISNEIIEKISTPSTQIVKDINSRESIHTILEEESVIEKLPNVFTPNNDGSNDEFKIASKGIKDFSIVIMDRENNVVFKSEDADFKWNGFDLKGDQAPEGNYIYYITGYNVQGQVITKYSNLKLMR